MGCQQIGDGSESLSHWGRALDKHRCIGKENISENNRLFVQQVYHGGGSGRCCERLLERGRRVAIGALTWELWILKLTQLEGEGAGDMCTFPGLISETPGSISLIVFT